MFAALAGAGARVFDRLMQIAGSHAQAGHKSEENCGEDCDENGPAEGRAVDVQRTEERERDGALMCEPFDKTDREQQAEDGAGAGEDEALGEQLTHDTAAACAESAAHGELLAARGGASQK